MSPATAAARRAAGLTRGSRAGVRIGRTPIQARLAAMVNMAEDQRGEAGPAMDLVSWGRKD